MSLERRYAPGVPAWACLVGRALLDQARLKSTVDILGGFADQNTYRRALIHAWACASAEGGESG